MNKEIIGKIKKINEAKTIGANGFRKRETVVTTDEQYPQSILIEFVQDKCELLDTCKIGQDVKISINLRGREWISPENEVKYFNAIQGWAIVKLGQEIDEYEDNKVTFIEAESDDIPF